MDNFYYVNTNGILTLKCKALDALGVKHAFTTRVGGVSTADKAYTNLSFSREPYETVAENYARIASANGFAGSFSLTHQTHTANVNYVEKCDKRFDISETPVDGLVTDKSGICLCVFTADCTPVLLADKKGRAVAAVHSGWRGTVGRIAVNAAEMMRDKFGVQPCELVAAIGPHIGRCCYEVGNDVYDAFLQLGDSFARFLQPRGDKFMLDMGNAIEYMLKEYGVTDVYTSHECTYCNADKYYSHRRTGNARGNMAGMIEL